MGGFFLKELLSSDRWSVKYIFDTNEESRRLAVAEAPGVKVIDDAELIFDDPEVDVVILTALADSRPDYIRRCVQAGKHIIAEKPLGDTVENEKAVVELVSNSGLLTAVDLYLRNSWYHNTIRDFIDSGEIGDLATLLPVFLRARGMTTKVPLFTIAACTMSTLPAGTPEANTRLGMLRA